MYAAFPKAGKVEAKFLEAMGVALESVMGVRNVRAQKQLSPRESLKVCLKENYPAEVLPVLEKLANVAVAPATDGVGVSFMVRSHEVKVLLEGKVDTEAEKVKILADIAYQEQFLATTRKKLSNESFVAHAPEAVVANERKKESDSLAKLEALRAALAQLQ